MDIDHARLLAHTILHQEFIPVAGCPPPNDNPGEDTSSFHGVVAKALATYADNASTLTRTTRSMADSALHTLTVVGAIDSGLAGDFHRIAGRRT